MVSVVPKPAPRCSVKLPMNDELLLVVVTLWTTPRRSSSRPNPSCVVCDMRETVMTGFTMPVTWLFMVITERNRWKSTSRLAVPSLVMSKAGLRLMVTLAF